MPFMKVTAVEHYPSKTPRRPAAHVVIRLEAAVQQTSTATLPPEGDLMRPVQAHDLH